MPVDGSIMITYLWERGQPGCGNPDSVPSAPPVCQTLASRSRRC